MEFQTEGVEGLPATIWAEKYIHTFFHTLSAQGSLAWLLDYGPL